MKTLLSVCTAAVLCATRLAAADVTMIGSRTMFALNTALTARFHQTNPTLAFHVSDAGTAKGIEALIAGTADIAAVTRPLRPEESKKFANRYHRDPVTVSIAVEGIAVYLHPRNPVDALSVEQLGKILTGEITNWSVVGGPDLPIHVYSFDNTTGRYWYVMETVLGKRSFAPSTHYTTAPTLAAQQSQMLQFISNDPAGIGYGDFRRARVVKFVRVSQNGGRAYLPAPDEVQRGTYPLSRPLMYVLRNEPQGSMAEFLRWCQTQDMVIREADFVPLR
jgi:phosphate transport system substrate-binding protein